MRPLPSPRSCSALAAAIAAIALIASCSDDPEGSASACTKDVDCKGERVCEQGTCVDQQPRPATDGGSASSACEGITCTTPPPPSCVDRTTVREHAAAGSCADGTCSYPPSDKPCPSGAFCLDGVCAPPPSCAGGLTCNGESCCASAAVPGGSFSRSYDGVSTFANDAQYEATLSDFRVDKYEVTVGRFRAFVDAVVAGWKPATGSGKHTHLKDGGLNAGAEPGWNSAWTTSLTRDRAAWDGASFLACDEFQTWTATPGANENKPINCVDWAQSYAFCIWDDGFLPSEAEWNYAAAGGSEHRVYPWSNPPNATTFDATYAAVGAGAEDVGSRSPKGDARWGHSDFAANVWEWTLDWWKTPYSETACNDCALLTDGMYRAYRGGSFASGADSTKAANRGYAQPSTRVGAVGFRCARRP
jgi:formylglycine-generating enzyme